MVVNRICRLVGTVICCVLISFVFIVTSSAGKGDAQSKENVKETKKFETYRAALLKEHGIDIKDFKEKLIGGEADGQKITKYDLNQLLIGIKVELEHTTDKMIALEISTDHLEEISDYYTRLSKMESEAEKEAEKRRKH